VEVNFKIFWYTPIVKANISENYANNKPLYKQSINLDLNFAVHSDGATQDLFGASFKDCYHYRLFGYYFL